MSTYRQQQHPQQLRPSSYNHRRRFRPGRRTRPSSSGWVFLIRSSTSAGSGGIRPPARPPPTVVASVISRELSSAYPLLQLPPVTISCSHEHSAWHGTVSISASTLHSMVNDIYCSIASSGLTALVILNCHGGNYVLANVVQEGNAQGKRMALFPSGTDWAQARRSAGLVTSSHEDMHAGEIETSILLHAHPELVREGYHAADWVADDRRHLLTTGMGEYTRSGVIGRAISGHRREGQGSACLTGRQLRIRAGDPAEGIAPADWLQLGSRSMTSPSRRSSGTTA